MKKYKNKNNKSISINKTKKHTRKQTRKYTRKHVKHNIEYSRISKMSRMFGGDNNLFKVTYDNNDITNKSIEDLTNLYINNKLLNEPIITLLQPLENEKLYLVMMIDPDAPNGQNAINNFTYVHWIFTYKGNHINNKNILLNYKSPSPPSGTHRYIFNIYEIVDIVENEIFKIISNKQLNRTNYYNELKNILTKNNQNIKKISLLPVIFTVTAK